MILAIPILGLVVGIVEAASFFSLLPLAHSPFKNILVNIFFLNSLHLICPFLILAYWPQGRELVQKKFSNPKFLIFSAIALLLILGLAILSNSKLSSMAFWFWVLVPVLHAVRQSWGISLLMSKTALANAETPNEKNRLYSFMKKERLAMKLQSVGVLLILILGELRGDFFSYAQITLGVLGMGLGAYICYLAYYEPLFKTTNKFLFSLRFIMWPFIGFSIFTIWMSQLTHGMEYLVLMRRPAENVNIPVKAVRNWAITFVLAVIGIEVFRSIQRWDESTLAHFAASPWVWTVLVLYSFFTIVHYATDSVMYRFGDPDVRQSLEKYLVGYVRRN